MSPKKPFRKMPPTRAGFEAARGPQRAFWRRQGMGAVRSIVSFAAEPLGLLRGNA